MHIMQVRTLFLGALAALAAAQSDVLFFTRVPSPITDKTQEVILWSTNNTNTDITLTLLRGTSLPYDRVYEITNTAQNGQYIWEPPSWIANGDDYRLEISQAGQRNTFGPLSIQGANPPAVASHSESIAASISASISRSIAASINASISSSLSAANATANSTSTGARAGSTTNSAQTIPKATHASTTTTDTAGRGSRTGSAASSSTSGAIAPTDFSLASSAVTLILGAVAALFYLQ